MNNLEKILGEGAYLHREQVGTKRGFNHKVVLYRGDDNIIAEAVVRYTNRTWEVYQFETATKKAISNALEQEKITKEQYNQLMLLV